MEKRKDEMFHLVLLPYIELSKNNKKLLTNNKAVVNMMVESINERNVNYVE